jgi:hypothetical protein
MLKLIYAAFFLLISSAMFLFSKSKPVKVCKHELTGIVKERKDAQGMSLYIEGSDQKVYVPKIESDQVVISLGAKVKICYDEIRVQPDQSSVIRINDVVYLP